MHYSQINLNWQIKVPTTNSKGGRAAAVLGKDGKQIEIILAEPGPFNEPLRSPFGACTYGESEETRKNLDLNLNKSLEGWLQIVDKYLIGAATDNSVALFKKQLSEDEVRKSYTPLIRTKEGWPSKMRCKVNLNKVRVWSTDHERREVPESMFRDCNLWPKIVVKSLWFMGTGAWGLTVECTDIMIDEDKAECPWM